jgi:MerR family transcriptional regulator, light-induced transcriptional regulator
MTTEQLDADVPLYPVGVVADRIGIPTATLRSWNRRYGIGPTEHRPGSHRLYTERDVAVLHQMQQLIDQGVAARSAAQAVVPRQTDPSALLAAAFALDATTADRLIDHRLRDSGVVDTWDGLVRPAFAALSTLQTEGGDCIDVEHFLSRVTTRALQRRFDPSTSNGTNGNAAKVVLGCCEGEVHTLALEALTAALIQHGCPAVMLGASIPATAIVAAVRRLPDVRAVVLWSQLGSTADADIVATVGGANVPVMVAGPGWEGVRLGRRVARLGTLSAAVQRLTPTP